MIAGVNALVRVGIQVVTQYLRDREAIAIAGLIGDITGGYVSPPGC